MCPNMIWSTKNKYKNIVFTWKGVRTLRIIGLTIVLGMDFSNKNVSFSLWWLVFVLYGRILSDIIIYLSQERDGGNIFNTIFSISFGLFPVMADEMLNNYDCVQYSDYLLSTVLSAYLLFHATNHTIILLGYSAG